MLTGNTNEERIWNYLTAAGFNACGVAGLMGNLYAESGLNPQNLQNTYEKKLGYTDAAYTAAVDSGAYTNFAGDKAGYGLAQWTYSTRKAALLAYARAAGKSVGDLETQLAFLAKELRESFAAVYNTLKTAQTVRAASDAVMLKFERPANQSAEALARRAAYGQGYFDKYGKKGAGNKVGYTNSALVAYTKLSPNCNKPRKNKIDTITIHCFVGQVTVERGCEVFQNTARQASCNYVVAKDGKIGLCVEEANRSWCSSSAANDNRAVTIEVASDTVHPYAVTDQAYAALIDLVADICRRNGIGKLVWSTQKADRVNHKNGCNLTVHRDYANKACPGEYLYSRMGDIAAQVNKRLGAADAGQTPATKPQTPEAWAVPFKVRVSAADLNIRTGPGTNPARKGYIKPGVYTIVEVRSGPGASAWGKLKSGAGWISLDFCKKI